MKRILLNILAISVAMGLALPMIDGTMATWSDTETSRGNYIETGSLDLKVSGLDDEPWGDGVPPCFEILNGVPNVSYEHSVSLWNAGDVNGIACLHLKIVDDPDILSQHANVSIWYDNTFVTSGSIYDLACHQILLGDLPACNSRDLRVVLHATTGASGDRLEFDIQFELVGSWADTEYCSNSLTLMIETGGSPGFWSSPGALEKYGKSHIVSWFKTIVLASAWYEDDLASGSDSDEVYNNMVNILDSVGAAGYTGMVNQFRAQYLATRLNTMPSHPRLELTMTHDISSVIGAEDYFGYSSETLAQIITTIESKATGDIFTDPPSRDEMEIMKDVCDILNNP